MQVVISYREISSFIEQQCQLSLGLNCIDATTLEVSYKPGRFVPTVTVDLHLEKVAGDSISLSYHCGMVTSFIIQAVQSYLQERLPDAITIQPSDRQIDIRLSELDGVDKVLEHLTLSHIIFETNAIVVDLDLR